MSDAIEAFDSATVEITLGGKTALMHPSLGAAIAINRGLGGYVEAVRKLANLDFDAIVFVVRHGLGLNDKQAKGLDEKVFASGMAECAAAAIRFVRVLMNGGKPLDDKADEAEDTEGNDEAAAS